MRTAILCNSDKIENVYELLVNPNLGTGVLTGSKICIDEHPSLPDIMEFELNKEEIKALQKLPDVRMAWVQFASAGHFYTPVAQTGIPRFATTLNFTGSALQIPHSLYYCQDYALASTDTNLNGTPVSLSSVDCSNIDILVMDSGVDANNPEFADDNGNSRVVQFNWTQLRYTDAGPANGLQVVNYQSPNYYEDTNGHGTACASLVAGRRCGFAKNARIYSLRSNELGQTNDGFTTYQCLDLALNFQKAKKLNLYGLSASRPTVMTNSWGYMYNIQIRNDFDATVNNCRWNGSLGKSLSAINSLPAFDITADSYIRQISQEGVHVLCAAGNNNAYIDHTRNNIINIHLWRPGNGANIPYFTIRTQQNDGAYVYNQVYTQNGVSLTYGYNDFSTSLVPYNYVSPNIGWPGYTNPVPYSKDQFPVIIVGDVTPIGNMGPDITLFEDGYPKAQFGVLSALSTESRIITDSTVRYNSPRGPYFIKSDYSNFGPAVDIYAPGRGCWAVYSNTIKSYDPIFNQGTYFEPDPTATPFIKLSNTLKYKYFNGTSAACPVVAGVLATYLADFPTASPLQARNWLLTAAVSGQIMSTTSTFSGVSSYNAAPPWGGTALTQTVSAAFGFDMFGQIRSNLAERYSLGFYGYLLRTTDSPFYKKLNMDETLVGARFFDSNNLIPQAFPLRKAIVSVDLNNFPDTLTTQSGTTLVRTTSSSVLPVTIRSNSPMISTFGFSRRTRVTSFADLTPGLPGLPTINSITVGNQSATVFFDPPANSSTALINYEYSLNNGINWTARSPQSTSSPLVITGLTNGTLYTIRIRAVSLTGPGPASNAVTATPGVFTIRVLGGGGGGGSGYCTATGGNGGHGGMVITTRPLPVGGAYSVGIGGGGGAAQSSGSRYNYGVAGGSGGASYFDTIYGNGGTGGARANSYARSADGDTSGTITGDTITIGPYNGYGQGGIGGTQNSNCEYSNSAQSGGVQGLVEITYQGPQRATGGNYSYDGTTSTHTFYGNGTFTITN